MKDMKNHCCASMKVLGNTLGWFLALTYTFSVLFCMLFDNQMYTLWQGWLPHFEWISWKSYFIGLVETFAYGWFFAIMFALACKMATGCCSKSACSTEGDSTYGSCKR